MRKQVSVFFASLVITLLCAFLVYAVFYIDLRSSAVIGYMPKMPELPEVIISAGLLDALRSCGRIIMPYWQAAGEILLGLLELLFQAV